MRYPNINGIRNNFISLGRKFLGKAIILLYHRVSNLKPDVQVLCVSPENFIEQMTILKEQYNPISLLQLYEASRKGKIPPRSVVLTFDDGYVDNFHDLKPILDDIGIPATVFVTAGLVDGDKEFWWHELEQLILSEIELPKEIVLKIQNKEYHWELTSSEQTGKNIKSLSLDWGVEDPSPAKSRQRIYSDLTPLMNRMNKDDREFLLQTLRDCSRFQPKTREKHRVMSSDELMQLIKGDLVDIGAHTLWHSPLPYLTKEEQWLEIKGSKDRLEKIIGRPIRSFAYPFSNKIGFNQTTLDLVQSAGFQVACAYAQGQVRFRSNPFQFPRFLVRNWDKEFFEGKLSKWFSSRY